jgi:preprotein translocase subunit SecF
MLRLFANANYDFIGLRRWAYGFSALLIVPGLLLLLARGLNYSIEFTGGTLIHFETREPVSTAVIRSALESAGIAGAEIQTFGSASEFVIRARLSPAETATEGTIERTTKAVQSALEAGLGADRFQIVRTEGVGPKVGRELQGRAFLAILCSFIVTLVYLAIRFEWRFGLAAILATAHDIAATLVFIRYLNLEVSLVVVAAVLTIVGYSLNDTIVIFDRVRENLRKYRRQNLYEILNLSVNETLPRTTLTGGSTILTALALALLAGEVIRPFALVMAFGIVVGTFSSIYVASPLLLLIERHWPGEDARGARVLRPAGSVPLNPPPSPGGGGGGGSGAEVRSKAAV